MTDFRFDIAALEAATAERADRLRAALEDRIRQNLSGNILAERSGALLGSISTDFEEHDGEIAISAESTDVDYAGILEYGGKTAAHEIVATKATALAFMVDGARRFARRVHHPGSVVPAFAYMSHALEDLKEEITSGLKEAVTEALGAG